MKFEKDTGGIKRYVAFDIHKEYALVEGQNAQQEWVMQPRRIGMEKLREWAATNLRKGDAVVIETTTNVWDVYDIVEPLVSYVVVPTMVRGNNSCTRLMSCVVIGNLRSKLINVLRARGSSPAEGSSKTRMLGF